MIRKEQTKNEIVIWLYSGCILVALMVLIGGITRLTQSGLSMVTWEPIMGIIPPLNQHEWQNAFDLYKQSPEFLHYNTHFNLSDFKQIFFWEYLHRLIGRIIGIIFILPCVIFWKRGWFDTPMKRKVIVIFLLGLLQGVVGWLMVKSGLIDKPHVSHFRLATHLIMACILIVYIYYTVLSYQYKVEGNSNKTWRKLLLILSVICVLQIVYGAFVAGLKAGLMYNNFPMMGQHWITPDLQTYWQLKGWMSLLENAAWVQFIHRFIGVSLFIFTLVLFFYFLKQPLHQEQRKSVNLFLFAVIIQVILGICTLIFFVPITLGVIHQLGAIILLLILTRMWFVFK